MNIRIDLGANKGTLKVDPCECYVEIKDSHVYKNSTMPFYDLYVNKGCVASPLTRSEVWDLYHKIQDACAEARKKAGTND
jgi:hypothetical protein